MDRTRSSGILMHISSLPGEYGIGDFGKGAYEFVDFLYAANQKNWQVLPLGITGFGDSPYQSFSAFAGNPYFIDLDEFIEKGYLKKEKIVNYKLDNDPKKVDYGLLFKNKMELIRIAYENSKSELKDILNDHYEEENWLREFAVFMAIKDHHNNKSWLYWDENFKDKDSKTVLKFEKDNKDEIYFWVFTQYFFSKQWKDLKSYANSKGINIIGDLPIYIAEDSSDIWGNIDLFYLDKNLFPKTVAGVPPDEFSDKGQLWGNPLYDWNAMEEDEYQWWIDRFKHSFKLYDVLRIDHFRGFEAYWEVDYDREDAVIGQWTKGPGMKLFRKVEEELGKLNIIAEDLGVITEEVRELLKDTGFPGMKILQHAFDSNGESEHVPHVYNKNTVVYTGTHDNSTIRGWFKHLPPNDIEYASKYLKLNYDEGLNWGIIRGAWSSVSYLAITTMQDILNYDDNARMNSPSTVGNNWNWRMEKSEISDEIIRKLRELTKLYRR